MNLKEPFKSEQIIIKKQENGCWTIFQFLPFSSSITYHDRKVLYTTKNENEAKIAFILLENWQKLIS